MKTFFALPEPDVEYRLAVRLLGQEPPLDREIVEELVGQPKRYSELQGLLAGRNDNVLNKALTRLRNEGLIQQGADLARRQKTYRLTHLGKLIVFRLHEMVPHRDSIAAYARGHALAGA